MPLRVKNFESGYCTSIRASLRLVHYLELHFYVRYTPSMYSRTTFISKLVETEASWYDNRSVCPNPDIRH